MPSYFEDISQDLRFALRGLRRQPGLVLTATLSAGLGIGVCTVVFGIVNFSLFQGLPVEEPERLMAIESRMEQGGENPMVSRIELEAIAEGRSWERIAFSLPYLPGALGPSGQVRPAWGSITSGNYFDVARPGFSLGQGFIAGEDDVEGATPKVVLSDAVWRERYGADESLLNRDVIVNGRPMMLVGVTAPEFRGTNTGLIVDYYLPLSQVADLKAVAGPEDIQITDELPMWFGLGRLREGVTQAQAGAELDILQASLLAQFPEREPERGFSVEPAGRVSRFLVNAVRPLFLLLSAVAVLVLITACANVANLLLARASVRGPEIATRLALGAGRTRIVRQLLTESVLLASAGGILGIGLAAWAGGLGGKLSLPLPAPIDLTLPTDYRTVGAAVGLCFACGVLFGLMPALRSTKTGVFDGLRTSSSAVSTGSKRFGLRNALATAQIAMSSALLVCSLLLIRSFSATSAALIGGINPDGVSVISFDPAMSGYDGAAGRVLLERILREAETTPGILAASITDAIPAFGEEDDFAIEPLTEGDARERVSVISFTPGLLEALDVRLVDGEGFQAGSTSDRSLIIDRGLAERLFPGGGAVGSTVFDRNGEALQVVGVAENIGESTASSGESIRLAYRSLLDSYAVSQRSSLHSLSLVLKMSPTAPPASLVSQKALTGLDPNLVVSEPKTLQSIIDESMQFVELPAILFGACGLMGLVIASIGIYGVISFSVARRFREIGIRRALGAQGTSIVGSVVSHGAAVAAVGLVLGLAAGYGLGRVAESAVFGVNGSDATTYFAVAAAILVVALCASAVPAMRAASVNPSETLRSE